MTSTELKIGLTTSARPSSRVLKPPGGGHTNLFGDVDVKVNAPRPKYNQQNSSNLNACMNSVDPNIVVEQLQADTSPQPAAEKPTPTAAAAAAGAKKSPTSDTSASSNDSQQRGRIPPGGFSSGGFW